MPIKLGDALLYLDADDKQLKQGLDSAEKQSKGWGATMTGLFQGFGMGIFSAVGGAIQGAFSQIGESIGLASDLAETQSKVRVLFGESATAIEEWASGAAFNLGMTKQAALDSVGTLGNLFMQLGESSDGAADMSQSLVQLATDLGSFHNADPSEILDSMSAAFRGEYDSLQRYVPLINAATVEQRALADTGKAVASELTAQEKALATYQITIESAGAATNDFAETSGGWAGTMKILTAAWDEFKTLLGETLLPILAPLVTKLKEMASEALPAIADYIHNNVIPAIEAWAANFDTWWAEHGQPFIDDVKQAWDDIVSNAAEAMGITKDDFEYNLEGMKAIAQELGKEIGTGFGGAIGAGLEEWWDTNSSAMWADFFKAPPIIEGGLVDIVRDWFNGVTGSVTPQSAAPGGGSGGFGGFSAQGMMPQAVGITVNVDAANRSVADAARDGTLDALRQSGMR